MALDTLEYGVQRFIISASKDRYSTPQLNTQSTHLWAQQLQWLKDECSKATLGRIEKMEVLSNKFVKMVDRTGVKDENGEVNLEHKDLGQFLQDYANDGAQKQVNLTGENGELATWKPNGDYYPSCILDYYRFRMRRPQNNQEPIRRVWGPMSCAEWFGYIELAWYSKRKIMEGPLPQSLNIPSSSEATIGA